MMKTKNIFIVSIFAIWLAALWPLGAIQFKKFAKQHLFFKSGKVEVRVSSLDLPTIDTALASAFWLPRRLETAAYAFREFVLQVPNWIYLTRDSPYPAKRLVILREEAADEFQGEHSEKIYAEATLAIKHEADAFFLRTSVRPKVLIIPTKIFADQAHVEIQNVRIEDRKLFGLSDNSPQVGSELHQLNFEQKLRNQSLGVFSLIDFYNSLRSDYFPLYPFGSSHWSVQLIEKAGIELVSQIQMAQLAPGSCFDLEAARSLPPAKYEDVSADFLKVLGLDPSSHMAKSIETYEPLNRIPDLSHRKIKASCPTIYYVGTSYGVVPDGRGKITDAISIVYRGAVENHSVAGKGALYPIQNFSRNIEPKNSIVIWEIPFRFVKNFYLNEGTVAYEEKRTR